MNKWENGEGNPLYRAAVLVLGVMLVFNFLSFCVRFAGGSSVYYNEYGDMQRSMAAGNYPEILSMVSRNQAVSAKTRKDTSEFQAVAKYYEAASLYHAFAEGGDRERAAQMKAWMAEAEQGLVTEEFTEAAEKIRSRFRTEE